MSEEGPRAQGQLGPRLEDQEADDLTNLEFKSFDVKKRLNVDLERLDFGVLRQLFDVGDSYVQELDELKDQGHGPSR